MTSERSRHVAILPHLGQARQAELWDCLLLLILIASALELAKWQRKNIVIPKPMRLQVASVCILELCNLKRSALGLVPLEEFVRRGRSQSEFQVTKFFSCSE